jgi:tetratricopeptide (TPR) repeat protein
LLWKLEVYVREASVVEKAKGRAVYESIVRRRVDPALLEWTAGNNFRTRVYPIPAKGFKRIIIGFEQELINANESYVYYQPFMFDNKIDNFEITVEVINQVNQPTSSGNKIIDLLFNKNKQNWVAEKKFRNYVADVPLVFNIPIDKNFNRVFVERFENGNGAFYLTIEPKIERVKRTVPKKIGLLWDLSTSSKDMGTKQIFQCLNAYMEEINYPMVNFISFSNEIIENTTMQASQSNWQQLVEKIKSLKNDGATQLGCLDFSKLDCDEYILISDAMSNFGKDKINLPSKPIHTICASPSVNFSYLNYISRVTGGNYINLNELNSNEALSKLISLNYRFISATYDKTILSQVFPTESSELKNYFSMAGIIGGYSSDITLNFGIGDSILYQERITVINKQENYGGLVPKIWAQKQLRELDVFYEQNEAQITSLAKQYGVVTRNTSLLILDNLQDYITYEVIPKDENMKQEYFARLNSDKNRSLEVKEKHASNVKIDFNEWMKWYNKDFSPVKPIVEQEIKDEPNIDEKMKIKPKVKETKKIDPKVKAKTANANKPKPQKNSPPSDTLNEFVVTQYVVPLIDPNASTSKTVTRESYNKMATKNVNSVSTQSSVVSQTDANVRGGRAEGTETYIDGMRVIGNTNAATPGEFTIEKSQSAIVLNPWTANAEYMYDLKATPKQKLYEKYLELKPKYFNTPSFFIDVSDYFRQQNEPQLALRILSNLAELKLEDHQILRVLAHRLQELNENELAIRVYEEIVKIRTEEPQSYRDLGLAYEQNKEYQKALDALAKVINRKWDTRFLDIETLVLNEINHVIHTSNKTLVMDSLDQALIKKLEYDVRVVINWDTDNCDIDLWVTDPKGEKCYYKNGLTATGGKLSRDFTGGFGPEVFQIKNAIEGKYKVEVQYYGTRAQNLTGPSTVGVELYTNYGRANETKKVFNLRLNTIQEVINIGEIEFKK